MSWPTMYICDDCGMTFDEYESGEYRETYGEGVMRGTVSYMCCPSCGSDNIEEAEKCTCCGEYFSPDNLVTDFDGNNVCHECKEWLIQEGEWKDD